MRTIAILGTGCPRCQAMEENAEAAAGELGIEYELLRVTDVEKIMDYEVLMTPALAIDGEVVVVGIVPTVEQIRELLR